MNEKAELVTVRCADQDALASGAHGPVREAGPFRRRLGTAISARERYAASVAGRLEIQATAPASGYAEWTFTEPSA